MKSCSGCSTFPRSVLPQVVASSGRCAVTKGLLDGVPIAGIAGDQQAALFGQMCSAPGMAKCTFGTGAFMLLNTGAKPVISKNQLLTTIAWKIGDQTEYALEGSMLMAGAVVQWLRDELQMIRTSAEIEELAATVSSSTASSSFRHLRASAHPTGTSTLAAPSSA